MQAQNEEDRYPHPKLKWACRRGMLELDVLLGKFLDEHYLSLAFEDKEHFIRLLGQSDTDLFAWLLGKAQPQDEGLARLVNKIRMPNNAST